MHYAYISRVLRLVLRPALTWWDVGGFVAGLSLPLINLMTDEAFYLADGVIFDALLVGLFAVFIVRVLVAPYLIWRVQILYISELHQKLDGGVGSH